MAWGPKSRKRRAKKMRRVGAIITAANRPWLRYTIPLCDRAHVAYYITDRTIRGYSPEQAKSRLMKAINLL